MPRINIENSIYQDIRFIKLLTKKEFNLDCALGSLVRSWAVAQKWYTQGNRMIPISEWEKQELSNDLIEVGLAEIHGEFIRVAGADEQFAWLAERHEAGRKGGLASGIARAKNSPKSNISEDEANRSKLKQTKQNEPSSSSSPSSSFSISKKEKAGAGGAHALLVLWNEKRGNLPEATALSSARQSKIGIRWQEVPDIEWWTNLLERVKRSSFCTGGGKQGWKANFDWFLDPSSAEKILEGAYDDKTGGGMVGPDDEEYWKKVFGKDYVAPESPNAPA